MQALRPFPRTLQLVHRLEFGGAELLAERFARNFGGPDRVVIGCLDGEGPLAERLQKDGFRVVNVDRQPGAISWSCVRRLRKLIRDERIELIHAHQTTPFFYALVARGLFSSQPRILFTEHGRWFPDRGDWKRAKIQRWLLGKDDRVAAVGESVKRGLVQFEGIPSDRIAVVYNGVPTDVDATSDARNSVRNELSIPYEAFLVIQVARLDPMKNHRMAIETMQRLSQTVPHARLLIVGDGPERATLETEVEKHNLRNSVTFAGSRSDVPRLLRAADALILTSVSEGIPLTIIEAMVAGLPVVATSVGGVPEVVEHLVTGMLVDSGDAQALADSLQKLAESQELRRMFGDAGRRRAVQRFSEERMFAEYAALLGIAAP
jgi:glycosyltransferase involved in cell wall biosynthesis